MNCVAFQQSPPCDRPPPPRPSSCGCKLDEPLGHSIIGGKLKIRTLWAKDTSHIRLAQPRRRLDQRIEHRLQVKGRAADDLEHVGGGGLLLQRFAQLVEQARVLDGDDRLGGKILDQLNLFVGERARLLTVNDDRANQLVLFEHRYRNQRSGTSNFDNCHKRGLAFEVRLLCPDVGNVLQLLRRGQAEKWIICTRADHWVALPYRGECRRCAVHRNGAKRASVVQQQVAESGFANARRVFQHGPEDWLKFARRVR